MRMNLNISLLRSFPVFIYITHILLDNELL